MSALKRKLGCYDFDFSAWPVDYKWDKEKAVCVYFMICIIFFVILLFKVFSCGSIKEAKEEHFFC